MQQSCRGLARSCEHETYRALSVSANRKGVVTEGIDTASKLTGRQANEVRDAIDTLLDADLLERMGPGIYVISSPCKCKSEDIFERLPNTEHTFVERRGDSMRPGASMPDAKLLSNDCFGRDSDDFQGLSRSLPKNGSRRNTSLSAQLSGLVFYFRQACADNTISSREWNAAGLRANLNRWSREGLQIELIREMIDLFVKASDRQFTPRTVAWKLFVFQRDELEARARRRLPALPEEVDESIALMERGLERFRALAAS